MVCANSKDADQPAHPGLSLSLVARALNTLFALCCSLEEYVCPL